MTPPPPQIWPIVGGVTWGLAWNLKVYHDANPNQSTISCWVRPFGYVAVPLVLCGATYLAGHWWPRPN